MAESIALATNGTGVGIPPDERKAQLEQRYIELLERRIAALEHTLKVQSSDEQSSEAESDPRKDTQNCTHGVDAPKDNHPDAEASTNKALNDRAPQDEVLRHQDDGPSEEERQGLERIKFKEVHYNIRGFAEITDTDAATTLRTTKPEEKVTHAFTWLKLFDRDDKYSGLEVEIVSPALRNLLGENLKHHRDFPFHQDVIRFSTLFEPIIHNWTKLMDEAKTGYDDISAEEKQAKVDLDLLMEHITCSPGLEPYFRNYDPCNPPRHTTFEYVWALFAPGSLIYSAQVLKQHQVFILQKYEHNTERIILTCWSYDWDGEKFNRAAYDFEIEKFQDSKAINSLDYYPLEYHLDKNGQPDSNDLKKSLIERGKRFRQICVNTKSSQLFEYRGMAISDQMGITRPNVGSIPDDSGSVSSNAEDVKISAFDVPKANLIEIEGPVVVDFRSYIYYTPGSARMGRLEETDAWDECNCPSCLGNKALRTILRVEYDGAKEHSDFSDEQFLICPPRVLGYAMRQKTWCQLLVSEIKAVKHDKEDAFKRLVLPETHKTLVRSLVSKHGVRNEYGENNTQLEDIIGGKGKGLVILLHGPPGVGKTLTAESVAQVTRKPLFPVSVADIGLEPGDVEKNLSRLFHLAGQWKAVLLFDEADVFLEARENADVKRNALVSVLLRVMEYYTGILILTTNRIKTFDVAVQSRVHLALRYTDLSSSDRRKIFFNFYDQLTPENTENLKQLKGYIDDEFDEDFNGRQIRNVVSSAMALARGRNEKMTLKDIKQVVRSTREFQRYLTEESIKARQRIE